ncbi:MAG: hypothetical protein HQ509_03230 [Candidatus Marinimicrobia bacterium]|nr:hypothetical protein [Candidatus Neomarinimicrobiota bacterium]
MKKILTTLLALTLVFSFAFATGDGKSCGSKDAKKCCSSAKATTAKTVEKSDCSPLDGKCGSKKSTNAKASEKSPKQEKKKTTESAPI